MPAGFLLLSMAPLFGFRLDAATHERLTRDIYTSRPPIKKASYEAVSPVCIDQPARFSP
jgi:hypothetical protein